MPFVDAVCVQNNILTNKAINLKGEYVKQIHGTNTFSLHIFIITIFKSEDCVIGSNTQDFVLISKYPCAFFNIVKNI